MSRPDFLYLLNAKKFQNYPDLGFDELNYTENSRSAHIFICTVRSGCTVV
jgi:hypothetical protein